MCPNDGQHITPLPYPIAVLDCETTGLSEDDRILELGVVLLDSQLLIESTWTTLIRPEGGIGATNIHGIRDEHVADAPRFHGIAAHLGKLLDGRLVAAHFAEFDARFLAQECARFHVKLPPHESWTLCTCEHARAVFPELESHSLASCLAHCDIDHLGIHSAIVDAMATAQLFRELHLRQPFNCKGLQPVPWSTLLGDCQPAEPPLSRYAWTYGGSSE